MRPSITFLRSLVVATLIGTLLAIVPRPALAATPVATVEEVSATPGTAADSVEPFSMIGLTWQGTSETAPPLEVLVGGAWKRLYEAGEATDVGPDEGTAEAGAVEEEGTEYFTDPVWVESATGWRVLPRAGVRSVTVHLIRTRTELRPVLDVGRAGAAPAPHDGPTIQPRSSWGAKAPTGSISTATTLRMAVVHHTAGSNDYTQAQVPGIIAGIQSYHQSLGWSDIGYNFLVDKWGRIWEGRAGSIGGPVVGAHAAGANTGSVGVSLLGNYVSVAPPAQAIQAIGEVIGWKFALHGVDPNGTTTLTGDGSNKFPVGRTVTLPTIVGHRDVGQTTCPGLVQNHLGTIRKIAAQRSPVSKGTVDAFTQPAPDRVQVKGWAFDTRTADPVKVVLTRNGSKVATTVANAPRADVARVHPDAHPDSGWTATVPLVDGTNEICAYVAETTYEALRRISCRSFKANFSPIGAIDVLTKRNGVIEVAGWAYDPDTSDPIRVHVYLDNRGYSIPTDVPRPDVVASHPKAPATSGFSFRSTGHGDGPTKVCAHAINVGTGGSNRLLGCRTVWGTSSPIGQFVAAARIGDQVLLAGWALDPDTTATVNVVFFNNDRLYWAAPAMHHWDELVGRYPSHGTKRLFFTLAPLPKGTNRICAAGVNVGPGQHSNLGCHTVRR